MELARDVATDQRAQIPEPVAGQRSGCLQSSWRNPPTQAMNHRKAENARRSVMRMLNQKDSGGNRNFYQSIPRPKRFRGETGLVRVHLLHGKKGSLAIRWNTRASGVKIAGHRLQKLMKQVD